ncbi:hypothetical protein [Pelagibacterium montanilacus]|uniref:hypothetical protein n=1 Tax=Pelagibacterium montanilacus TaxID=2185280 RepID=UPI000F8DB60B|nr:hypothetical protein [Pelagibacterium montanilacus]
MRPETASRLAVLLCAAEALQRQGAGDAATQDFASRNGGVARFTGGTYEIRMAGTAGTATMGYASAFASWINAANRRLEKANG